jgi:DNA-binding response OmpR family regulator
MTLSAHGRRGAAVAEPGKTARGRILLIEDEPAIARLTELVLVSAGFAVVQTKRHESARELLHETAFDLVIADTEFGARATDLHGLSELAGAAGCPVLLFTAHRFSQAQVSAAGLAGIISKPFDIDQLLAVVERTVAAPGSTSDEDTSPGPA